MLERARLDLVVVAAMCAACGESSPPKPDVETVWAHEEQARALRAAMFDALGTRGEPRRDFQQWLTRPEICNVSNFVTRLEMAAGTFVWPDAFQFRGEDNRHFEFLREKWRDFLVVTLDSCDGARFGPTVRLYKRELERAFATPHVQTIISRWLEGTRDERDAALEIIGLAPSRVYYQRVAELARAGDMRARIAMINIDSLWSNENVPDVWSAWIQRRLDDSQPDALRDLLSISVGAAIPGAPANEIPVDVRRAAARTARVWRDTTLDGRLVVDERIVVLAKDSDDAIRREGVLMLEPTVTDSVVDLLEAVATTDRDPRIRLIAFLKLPKLRSEKLAPEQRP